MVVVLRDQLGFLGPKLDARHVGEAHDRASTVGDDELLELIGRPQVRVRQQVDLYQIAFGLADGRQEVVALECRVHVAG